MKESKLINLTLYNTINTYIAKLYNTAYACGHWSCKDKTTKANNAYCRYTKCKDELNTILFENLQIEDDTD